MSKFSTAGKTHLLVRGLDGNDSLFVDKSVTLDTTLTGGNGNDRLHGGSGRTQVIGQAGDDTADFSDFTAGVTVSLDDNANDGSRGRDNVRSDVENVLGGAGDDIVFGTSAKNVFRGGRGNDRLYGRSDNDRLFAGAGQDRLFGEDGSDSLFSRDGIRDWPDGGAGTDSAQRDAIDSVLRIERFIA